GVMEQMPDGLCEPVAQHREMSDRDRRAAGACCHIRNLVKYKGSGENDAQRSRGRKPERERPALKRWGPDEQNEAGGKGGEQKRDPADPGRALEPGYYDQHQWDENGCISLRGQA